MSNETVAVVGGGGQMGSGIALAAALAGDHVRLIDVTEADLERGLGRIGDRLAQMQRRETLTAQNAEEVRARITATTELSAVADCSVIFESVPEDLTIKLDTLRRVSTLCASDALIASNTSQISITELGAATTNPERLVGMHWFNPPTAMRLIEIVPGVETSPDAVSAAVALATRLGKESVVCKRDAAGFVTSRLIMAFNLEAVRILEEGIADVDDINRACVLAFNHPMGPLAMADLGGLDTFESAADGLAGAYGERFRAPQLLRALVRAGRLGRKTGRGFSDYVSAR